jgi:probable HAF family extracellular repeat protein
VKAAIVLFLAGLSAGSMQATLAQEAHARYTVIDKGNSLVRTLTDTPGLNNHGDIAIWHPISASSLPGVILHGDETITIQGDKDFSFVYPADINDQLTVVGILQQPQDLRFTHAFKWSDNHLETLEALGGPYSTATAINGAGDVAGSAQTNTETRHAVLWRGKHPRDLGVLAKGDYSSARDINDKDEIVGEANITPNGKPKAFLWHANVMKQLPDLPGGTICSAQAINNHSTAVGSCDLPSGLAHGVIWKDGTITDLGALGDEDAISTALDINSSEQVVGCSTPDDKLRAFLWEKGKMIDLNKAIVPHSGWTLLVASRINDKGEILGRGYYHNYIHVFLLKPDQAPAGK